MQSRNKRGQYTKRGGIRTNVLVGAIIMFLVGWGLYNEMSTSTYTKTATSTPAAVETVEVKPVWAEDEDAVAAAKAVIRKKELEAEEARLVEEITAKQDELDAIRIELKKY